MLGMVDGLLAEVRRDPAAVQVAEQTRLTYLEVQRRPLLLALFVRDQETLGTLLRDASADPRHGWNTGLADDLFVLLRQHGLMRTDMDVETASTSGATTSAPRSTRTPAPGRSTPSWPPTSTGPSRWSWCRWAPSTRAATRSSAPASRCSATPWARVAGVTRGRR
ncbi:hypothetical protein BJF78_11560 [Pseudonocardia sp. CNS-139]|nr:hypothetical protein BJF78_11560 [Pseudonocardia sp. CNS-139]